MILDKLMETKDLKAYIKYRIEYLERQKKKIKSVPEKQREEIVNQIRGRIRELRFLNKLIWGKNLIKLQSKEYWIDLNKDGFN